MDVKRGPSEQKWTDEYKPSNLDVSEEYSIKSQIWSTEPRTCTNSIPRVAPEAILNWCGEKIFKETYRVYRETFFKTHFIKNCKTGVATATPVL